ncbi:unnamed protein product [Aspergillus oryzae]|nr:unnamed protein product [Aspergillus oryzae]
MAPQVWFITGASSGLGLSLSLYALSAGHHVIGTVRNASKSADAVQTIQNKGGKIVELDVTKADAIPEAVKKAESFYGKIDVLVNNAGYSLLGAVEDLKSGTIVNISSVAGQDALPSCGLYSASKFALEGLSESLSRELAPFNISVLVVEPGAFRTNFLSAVQRNESGLSEPYKGGPVDTMLGNFESAQGKQKGDPKKAIARIFEVVTGEGAAGGLKGQILRLPLGPDCVQRMQAKLDKANADLNAAREFALNTNYD